MRPPIIAGIALLGWLGIPLPRIAQAQNTLQDSQGRFAIDLPPAFKLSSEQLGRIYIYQADDARLFVAVIDGASGRDQVWRSALDDFTGPGVPAPPVDSVSDLAVNGNPARLARYGFDSGSGATKVPFTALLGAVWLRDSGTGVVCFSLLTGHAAGRWGDALQAAFHSIRIPGAVVIGAALSPPSDGGPE